MNLRFRLSHTQFVLAFPTILFVVCNAFNIGRISKWFREGDSLDLSALAAFLLAANCLTICVVTIFAHRWTLKPFAILLTVLSAVATYFISKYGVAIDSSMIRNAIHTDSTEVGQLLSVQMVPYAIVLIAIPAAAIILTELRFSPSGKYLLGSLKVFSVTLSIALASLGIEYNAIFRAGNISNKYIVYSLVPINVISGSVNAASKALKPWFETDQKSLEISAVVTRPGDLVVVLAIGESSRRKNFGVYGYARRDTTPELAEIDGLHLLNAVATRASTLYALPKILEKEGVKLTTVVSRAGVPTVCYVNYTLYDNCAAVGETKVNDCARGGRCYDGDVIPLLKADLAQYRGGYRFVVLHFGGGSHGPLYSDRHPPEFLRFKPSCLDADVANQCSLEELQNSYDNTILYVDHVLSKTIQTLDATQLPYVFMYLSDHGESLMEDGMLFHGVPPGVQLPAEQAEIPLIVKSSVPTLLVERDEYQQPDVFDTVLSLFSIESKFDRAGAFVDLQSRQTSPPKH